MMSVLPAITGQIENQQWLVKDVMVAHGQLPTDDHWPSRLLACWVPALTQPVSLLLGFPLAGCQMVDNDTSWSITVVNSSCGTNGGYWLCCVLLINDDEWLKVVHHWPMWSWLDHCGFYADPRLFNTHLPVIHGCLTGISPLDSWLRTRINDETLQTIIARPFDDDINQLWNNN